MESNADGPPGGGGGRRAALLAALKAKQQQKPVGDQDPSQSAGNRGDDEAKGTESVASEAHPPPPVGRCKGKEVKYDAILSNEILSSC